MVGRTGPSRPLGGMKRGTGHDGGGIGGSFGIFDPPAGEAMGRPTAWRSEGKHQFDGTTRGVPVRQSDKSLARCAACSAVKTLSTTLAPATTTLKARMPAGSLSIVIVSNTADQAVSPRSVDTRCPAGGTMLSELELLELIERSPALKVLLDLPDRAAALEARLASLGGGVVA